MRLAEAFGHMPDVQFLMVGSMDGSKHLKEQIETAQRKSHLGYLGQLSLERVNALLAQSHIFVNTSIYEGFPNTFIQAWMRKVPVLSLTVNPDGVLTNEGVGLVSGTYERLTRNLDRLIRDTTLRVEMADRAQAYAFRHHSTKNFAQVIRLLDPNELTATESDPEPRVK